MWILKQIQQRFEKNNAMKKHKSKINEQKYQQIRKRKIFLKTIRFDFFEIWRQMLTANDTGWHAAFLVPNNKAHLFVEIRECRIFVQGSTEQQCTACEHCKFFSVTISSKRIMCKDEFEKYYAIVFLFFHAILITFTRTFWRTKSLSYISSISDVIS